LDILDSFAQCLAFENNVPIEAARSLVTWMENEGVLDYDILKETYLEPERAANDA
jgi:hypothetical protein